MGSFGGVKVDAQNFEQTVQLAQEKALLEQNRVDTLAQSLTNYREGLLNSTFPDGQYYVTADFTSQQVVFQGDMYNPNKPQPIKKVFKKGELVDVVTTITDMAMSKTKVIKTSSGDFYADQNNLSKTKPAEPVVTESKEEIKQRNGDNTKIMIAIAFVLGYLLSKE
jgi:hypothetical protein